ncbi:MAG: 23S rRNA (guanosine(2251)-2'-O)-methyltransferase RlmB [Campylobacterota bacterium]|nr:23S rRNA (guanosine(2251)-2'-O)-methyltransferase RlmB [Campylobacterota bacterium]
MLIYGKQPIQYLLEKYPQKIQKFYLAKDLDKKDYNSLMNHNFNVKRIPQSAADIMAKGKNHQGFLADVDDIEPISLKDACSGEFVLILSSITDVGNIGAIIRSAYAFGVDSVIITGLKSLAYEQIVRSSSGALFDINIAFHTNIFDVINELKLAKFKIYGASMDGKDVRSVTFDGKRALIMGSESEGISKRALSKLDESISISMSHGFDSLNVSVATAILIDRMR